MPFIKQESIEFDELKRYTVTLKQGGKVNTDNLDEAITVGSGCITSVIDHFNQTVSQDGVNWRDIVRGTK